MNNSTPRPKVEHRKLPDTSKGWQYEAGEVWINKRPYVQLSPPSVLPKFEKETKEEMHAIGRLIALAPSLLAERDQLKAALKSIVSEFAQVCDYEKTNETQPALENARILLSKLEE